MEMGMVGLGRMGAAMVRRLMVAGHRCVVFDVNAQNVQQMGAQKAVTATSLQALVEQMQAPRVVWLMVPAGSVGATLRALVPHLQPDDVVIDGGNSRYHDAIARAASLRERGIHYVDVGTSGGVWGEARGYCLMVGTDDKRVFKRCEPLLRALAPGVQAASRTRGRDGDVQPGELGYLHCGPAGAGHFVKMVHNGIEYGMMAAYAEGLNVLRHANVGKQAATHDAETTPLAHPEHYAYDFNLAEITELWRRGSVVSSWLLDLAASALHKSGDLEGFSGHVSDSGEGRWTLQAAIDEAVPAPVLSAAVYARFSSRGQGDFADKLLSALRFEFGGHREKTRG